MRHIIHYGNAKFECFNPLNAVLSERDRINALSALKIYISKDAYLFVLRRDRNKIKDTIHRFDNIQKAIRAEQKIQKWYFGNKDKIGETFLIQDIELLLESILAKLSMWGEIDIANLYQDLKQIEDIIKKLEGANLELKQEIAKRMMPLNTVTDSQKKQNPGAKMAIAVGAKVKTTKRVNQITVSKELSERRLLTLQREETAMQTNLLKATLKFGTFGSQISTQVDAQRQQKEFGQIMFLLQSVWLNPYKREAEKLRELLIQKY